MRTRWWSACGLCWAAKCTKGRVHKGPCGGINSFIRVSCVFAPTV